MSDTERILSIIADQRPDATNCYYSTSCNRALGLIVVDHHRQQPCVCGVSISEGLAYVDPDEAHDPLAAALDDQTDLTVKRSMDDQEVKS